MRRRSSAAVLTLGALAGAAIGLVLWALGFTAADTGWLAQTVVGAVIGGPAGAALALVARGLTRTDPDVPETGQVAPRQFDILVDEELAPAAREALVG